MRYKVQYEKEKLRIKQLWDNWLPERYRKLKPAGQYEFDILMPGPAFDSGNGGAIPDVYRSFIPDGVMDGVNTIFTVPNVPTTVKVFLNGLLLSPTIDYTFSGSTITFVLAPQSDDTIVVWTFVQGV